jgi:hypothetical protein
MSLPHVTPDADAVAVPTRPEPAGAGRRWSVPELPRLWLPLTGIVIFAAIRVLSVVIAALILRHGKFHAARWSLARWLGAADGGHYRDIAAHGYAYPAGQLAHASVFSWFPGYPAAIDSIAWLPGVTIVSAGLIVTAVAGLATAWGLTTLGMKLTADPRISLLMVAIWAVAPSSTVLSMLYAEALFCALAVWALVALTGRRWLTAAGLTIAAGTVRSTALALIAAVAVAALIALIQAARTRQRVAMWWRPLVAAVLAPLGLLAYLGYVARATHRLDGWFWIEKHTCHMALDWGVSTLRVVKGTIVGAPSVSGVLVVLAIIAAVVLAVWSLTERIPVYLHVYTVLVVVVALATSANWVSSKPRFVLPAVLLALPVARLLAPVRTSVLVPLVALLTAASTWFGLYLLVIGRWAP